MPNLQVDSAPWGSANGVGFNGLEDPATVPFNSLNEWDTDATIVYFLHNGSGPPDLQFDINIGDPLDETFLLPLFAQINTNLTMSPRKNVDTPDLNAGFGHTSNLERRSTTTQTVGSLVKRRRDNIACARCWLYKKKVRSIGKRNRKTGWDSANRK
jgi:hypothetical protein